MTAGFRIDWFEGPSDLEGVLEIDRESFSAPWTRAMYEQELQDARHAFIAVLRTATEPVAGYCSYRLVAGEVQINNLAVRKASRRAGLGRALVAFVLRHGARNDATLAVLEVRRSNDAARRLYAGLGFVESGTRAAYYAEPQEDALVMTRDLRNLEWDPVA